MLQLRGNDRERVKGCLRTIQMIENRDAGLTANPNPKKFLIFDPAVDGLVGAVATVKARLEVLLENI